MGDAEALRILRERLQYAADTVERDMRTGGRFHFETDLATGREVITLRPKETSD